MTEWHLDDLELPLEVAPPLTSGGAGVQLTGRWSVSDPDPVIGNPLWDPAVTKRPQYREGRSH